MANEANLKHLMALVDDAYGDGLIAARLDPWRGLPWPVIGLDDDTLATFIVRELHDTCGHDEMAWPELCDEAITALQRAQDDLERVVNALIDAHHADPENEA